MPCLSGEALHRILGLDSKTGTSALFYQAVDLSCASCQVWHLCLFKRVALAPFAYGSDLLTLGWEP